MNGIRLVEGCGMGNFFLTYYIDEVIRSCPKPGFLTRPHWAGHLMLKLGDRGGRGLKLFAGDFESGFPVNILPTAHEYWLSDAELPAAEPCSLWLFGGQRYRSWKFCPARRRRDARPLHNPLAVATSAVPGPIKSP